MYAQLSHPQPQVQPEILEKGAGHTCKNPLSYVHFKKDIEAFEGEAFPHKKWFLPKCSAQVPTFSGQGTQNFAEGEMRISYLVPSPDTSACDEDSMSDKIDMLPFCGGRNHAVVISKSSSVSMCTYTLAMTTRQPISPPPPPTSPRPPISVLHNIT